MILDKIVRTNRSLNKATVRAQIAAQLFLDKHLDENAERVLQILNGSPGYNTKNGTIFWCQLIKMCWNGEIEPKALPIAQEAFGLLCNITGLEPIKNRHELILQRAAELDKDFQNQISKIETLEEKIEGLGQTIPNSIKSEENVIKKFVQLNKLQDESKQWRIIPR